MENSETAHHLIEVQSLLNKVSFHKKNIKQNFQRTDSIKQQREKSQQRLEEVHTLLKSVDESFNNEDLQLQKESKELEHKNQQRNLVTSEKELNAIEHDIITLEESISQLEQKALEHLEEKEKLEQEISDLSSFCEGSLKSLQNVEKEVEQLNQNEDQQINNYQDRIDQIISLLPPVIGKEFLGLIEKFEDNKPLSFLKSGNCGQCHYSIPRALEEALQKSFCLEFCPNCNRVLIPENVPH